MRHARRIAKWGMAVLILALAASQLVPVNRTNPPAEAEIPADATARAVLRRACYDCHSNETVWPGYSRIAPVSWLIAHDVHEGREELNLSTWNRYTTKQQLRKLKEVAEEVAEGEMPPWQYLPPHPEARLSRDDRAVLIAWSQSLSSEISSGR